LANILKFHVTAGQIYSKDFLKKLKKLGQAQMIRTLLVEVIGDDVFVWWRQKLLPDIPAANGIVHV